MAVAAAGARPHAARATPRGGARALAQKVLPLVSKQMPDSPCITDAVSQRGDMRRGRQDKGVVFMLVRELQCRTLRRAGAPARCVQRRTHNGLTVAARLASNACCKDMETKTGVSTPMPQPPSPLHAQVSSLHQRCQWGWSACLHTSGAERNTHPPHHPSPTPKLQGQLGHWGSACKVGRPQSRSMQSVSRLQRLNHWCGLERTHGRMHTAGCSRGCACLAQRPQRA